LPVKFDARPAVSQRCRPTDVLYGSVLTFMPRSVRPHFAGVLLGRSVNQAAARPPINSVPILDLVLFTPRARAPPVGLFPVARRP